jgi:hypothetical protein
MVHHAFGMIARNVSVCFAILLGPLFPAPPVIPHDRFDAYLARTHQRVQRELSAEPFLWAAQYEPRLRRVRTGEAVVEPVNREGTVDIGRALVHDWVGAVFIPGVHLNDVAAFLQDYGSHKLHFKPEVTDSRLVSRQGDEFRLYYRIVKKKLITIVVNSDHVATYTRISPSRMASASHTTRIAEVEHAGKANEREVPPEKDPGLFWQLNTYWRMEERDGGVYVECQSITLTCPVPLGLGWLINPIVRGLPGESLAYLLNATRKGVLSRH